MLSPTAQLLGINTQKNSQSLVELDVLRGMAVVFMVYNHTTYELLVSQLNQEGIFGFLTFLTGFAPVLFFFATGVGYGLQNNKSLSPKFWLNTFYKVALLIIADQFLYWRTARGLLGIDFLGFIGISILVMAIIRASKAPIKLAILIIISSFILRFFLGNTLLAVLGSENLVTWISGAKNNTLFPASYPLSPWIIYPCCGYLLGALINQKRAIMAPNYTHRSKVIFGLLIAVCFFVLTSSILLIKQVTIFRWGTVSFGFYWLSLGLLSIVVLALYCGIKWLQKSPSSKYLQIRGMVSLATVPAHYLIIFAATLIFPQKLDGLPFLGLFSLIYWLTLVIAHRLEALAKYINNLGLTPVNLLWGGTGLVMINVFLCPTFSSLVWVTQLTSFFAQSIICILFTLRW